MGVVAIAVVVGTGLLIYRQSQPNLGDVPQINMSREEIERGAMGGGLAASATLSDASEPASATPSKGAPASP